MPRFLEHLGQFWGVVTTVRFPALFTIVFFLITVFVSQVQDLLWLIAEKGWQWHGVFSLVVAATIFALNAWYWARLALYARNVPAAALTPFGAWLENQLPRILGSATYLMLAISCFEATKGERSLEAPVATRQLYYVVAINAALCVLFYLFAMSRRRLFTSKNWQAARDEKVRAAMAATRDASRCRPLPFGALPATARLLIWCFLPAAILTVVLCVLLPAGTGRL